MNVYNIGDGWSRIERNSQPNVTFTRQDETINIYLHLDSVLSSRDNYRLLMEHIVDRRIMLSLWYSDDDYFAIVEDDTVTKLLIKFNRGDLSGVDLIDNNPWLLDLTRLTNIKSTYTTYVTNDIDDVIRGGYDHIWSTSPHVYVDFIIRDKKILSRDRHSIDESSNDKISTRDNSDKKTLNNDIHTETSIASVCNACNTPSLVFMIKDRDGNFDNYNNRPAVTEVYNNNRLRYFYYSHGIPEPIEANDPVEVLIDASVMNVYMFYLTPLDIEFQENECYLCYESRELIIYPHQHKQRHQVYHSIMKDTFTSITINGVTAMIEEIHPQDPLINPISTYCSIGSESYGQFLQGLSRGYWKSLI